MNTETGTPDTAATLASESSTPKSSRRADQEYGVREKKHAGSARRKSLNHRELKGKLRMGTLSLQTATRYKEPEPNSESSSDDELFLKSEIRPGRGLKDRSPDKQVDVEYVPRVQRASNNESNPEKQDAGLLANTSAQSPLLVLSEEESRVDHDVTATPGASREVKADSSQQEMPRRTSKPPATPASPGQVLKVRTSLNRESNYFKEAAEEAAAEAAAKKAQEEAAAKAAKAAEEAAAKKAADEAAAAAKAAALKAAAEAELRAAEEAEEDNWDAYFRLRSAGRPRRSAGAQQPDLRRPDVPAKTLRELYDRQCDSPPSMTTKSTIITITDDEVKTTVTVCNNGIRYDGVSPALPGPGDMSEVSTWWRCERECGYKSLSLADVEVHEKMCQYVPIPVSTSHQQT